MAAPNAYNTDIFSMLSLTQGINLMPYVPGRVGELGLFTPDYLTTTTVSLDFYNNTITVVPTTPRGGSGTQMKHDKRTNRVFTVPHIQTDDSINADEIQNVRAFGSENTLESIINVRDRRLRRMAYSLDATLEWHRIGAIKGVILDSDASTVIYNLFTEFGVTETQVDFVLGTTTTSMRAKCLAVSRAIEDELGMVPYDHVHALCGRTWFERFIDHPTVRDTFLYQEGQRAREDVRKNFEFSGIVFEEYRGTVNGTRYIADSEVRFFPVGVPDLFITAYAPADYMETVNTPALARYAKAIPRPNDKGMDLEAQSNPFCFCTRPKTLVKGITSN